MKTYKKPTIESIPADACILADSLTLDIHNKNIIDGDVDNYYITDGSQILAPRVNLWDDEEEEK